MLDRLFCLYLKSYESQHTLKFAHCKLISLFRSLRAKQKMTETFSTEVVYSKKEQEAAVKIQAQARGMVQRKELKQQNDAALKIQAQTRGMLVRKKVG